jgi:hypothetical protein
LDKLPYAKGAMFNSYDEDYITCYPATRVDLLRQIQDWAQQPRSKSIFWLNGAAGTGKSTISRTFAEWLTQQGRLGVVDLGASFFFKRGEGDRGSASRFFSTITRELVLKIPGLDTLVAEVITSDPFIFDKSLGEQFDKKERRRVAIRKYAGTLFLSSIADFGLQIGGVVEPPEKRELRGTEFERGGYT